MLDMERRQPHFLPQTRSGARADPSARLDGNTPAHEGRASSLPAVRSSSEIPRRGIDARQPMAQAVGPTSPMGNEIDAAASRDEDANPTTVGRSQR